MIQTRLIIAIASISLIWYGLFFQGINSATVIWWGNEIFNHCLFVIPAAYYLIYRQRSNLDMSLLAPNYWALIPIVGCLFLYAFGQAGDIQLFMHIAAFTALPCIWLLVLGHRLARKVAFPLLFMLFSIPVGEQLIPKLQEITASAAIYLLDLTGIPNFSTGLYIEIPQGRFLVAEACSGISFLIASIVIGTLFIHLNIHSNKRKLGFLFLSITFPIVANALRVYGIILIAYLTDMEYAAGADHLIYGWFFFAIVLAGLLLIGQLFIDEPTPESEAHTTNSMSSAAPALNQYKPAYPMLLLAIVLLPYQYWVISLNQTELVPSASSPIEHLTTQPSVPINWTAEYNDAYDSVSGTVRVGSNANNIDSYNIDYFIGWYPAGQGEMLSSLNRLYNEKRWTYVSGSRLKKELNQHNILIEKITNGTTERLLGYYYVIDDKVFIDKLMAKLYQTINILKGTHKSSIIRAYSLSLNSPVDIPVFLSLIEKSEEDISLALNS